MYDDRKHLPTQDTGTRTILEVIKEARLNHSDSPYSAARKIEDFARGMFERDEMRYEYRLTPSQYQSIENGYTKDVPLWVVLVACHVYAIGPGRLLGDVLGEYGY